MKKKWLAILKNNLVDYPTPINLSYLWTFGFSAAICLVVQIFIGIFLAMHYIPHIDLTFLSIDKIVYYSSYPAMVIYIICYIYIARGTYYSVSKNGYFLGVIMLANKVVKGTATKATLITNAMLSNKSQLVGIDTTHDPRQCCEFVSHFEEMRKIQSLKEDYIYLPITNHINKLIKGPDGKGYQGALHDGLVYDLSNDTIIEKIEFKARGKAFFGKYYLDKFIQKYEPLGVDRIDLCHGNVDSYKQTILQINKMGKNSSSIKFKAQDFSEFFDEKINNDAYRMDVIDKVIDKQIELQPFILDVQYRLLTHPDFFSQDSTTEINLELFERVFACNLSL